MSALETAFAAVITVVSAAGLILTSHILEGWDKVRWQMFRFYTSLSNAAVFLTHVLLLFPGPAREVLRSPRGRYILTLCILVTFLVWKLVPAGGWRLLAVLFTGTVSTCITTYSFALTEGERAFVRSKLRFLSR